jgi:DNA-binding response OmpR family regulator
VKRFNVAIFPTEIAKKILDSAQRRTASRGLDLPPIQLRIFWFVAANPQGVTRVEIFDMLYEEREDGGPFDHTLSVHLRHLNRRLQVSGLVIRTDPPRAHGARYQLRRIDNTHIWLPRNKI